MPKKDTEEEEEKDTEGQRPTVQGLVSQHRRRRKPRIHQPHHRREVAQYRVLRNGIRIRVKSRRQSHSKRRRKVELEDSRRKTASRRRRAEAKHRPD